MPFIALAETTPENTSTEPTDRSMPAVMITNVIPTAITIRIAAFVARFRKLLTVANESGSITENTTIIAARMRMIHVVDPVASRCQRETLAISSSSRSASSTVMSPPPHAGARRSWLPPAPPSSCRRS
jgi:hypothetical protein